MSTTGTGGELSPGEAAAVGSREAERAEAYRAAARAAVAELDEIESVVMSLEARLVGLRTRARSLGSLLDAIGEVVPDAAPRPGPFTPAPPLGDPASALPRRRRLRERAASGLDGLPVRLGPGAPTADDLVRAGLLPAEARGEGSPVPPTDARHVDASTRPPFDPAPVDVEAWG